MNIDNPSEKIQFDVRRLASYKRTQEALPQQPDADYVLIEVKTQQGNDSQLRVMRQDTYWLSNIDSAAHRPQGGVVTRYIARDWGDLLQRIANRGWEITSIRLARLHENILGEQS